MLEEFIATHREELIRRTREKVASRAAPLATMHELTNGVPLFLTQLGDILRHESAQGADGGHQMGASAALHGSDMFLQGFALPHVVHDYGDVCQAVTELALDLNVGINTDDFRTLNRCLDNAIASAVSEYSRQHDMKLAGAETMRQGVLAHELRNHLNTASLAFQIVKSGKVGVTGSTMGVLERSLDRLRDLIDRTVAEVRLNAGAQQRERLPLTVVLDEVMAGGSIEAANRGLHLTGEPVDARVWVEIERHQLASAISNVLQNAFKFTRPAGHVSVRTHVAGKRVFIEIQDECGGLLPGAEGAIFQPFEQRSADRTGMGLGLSISRQAVEAVGGGISLRNLPGTGCKFTLELPCTVGGPADN